MKTRVLIVDDDESFSKMVQIRLRNWRPDMVIRSAEAIEAAREILDKEGEHFNLIVLDQHLPDGKGSELMDHPKVEAATVLAVSSDDAPELPGRTVVAGAQHFLHKRQISEPLFIPLVESLMERKHFETQLLDAKLKQSKMETIKTLLATLRHEINNPLGAVLGGTYLLNASGDLDEEQAEALRLIEASGNRIKHVLEKLCEAAELETVTKGREALFHVPGDAPWKQKKK